MLIEVNRWRLLGSWVWVRLWCRILPVVRILLFLGVRLLVVVILLDRVNVILQFIGGRILDLLLSLITLR